MKRIFYTCTLFFAVSCSSGGDTNNFADSAKNSSVKGNSPGSNLIEMDTMRTDTPGHSISTDSAHL